MLSLYLTAKVDEKRTTRKSGEDFEVYLKKTELFIPRIFQEVVKRTANVQSWADKHWRLFE